MSGQRPRFVKELAVLAIVMGGLTISLLIEWLG